MRGVIMRQDETVYIRIIQGDYIGCGGYLLSLPRRGENTRALIWKNKKQKKINLKSNQYRQIMTYKHR
jgi:hypothetical protein